MGRGYRRNERLTFLASISLMATGGSLGSATLDSNFDPAGLRSGLDSALTMTNGWLGKWQGAFTTAVGFIIARIVEGIGRAIVQLGGEIFKAISDVQTRTIQMTGLMAQEIRNAVNPDASLADFFDEGAVAAQEMLKWVREIAVTTPFTVESLNNTISMAMAFGLTSDQAKTTTMAIGNFTAGMGLGNDVMERIIYNFGQMLSAGKISGTELRDLSRGALVPVNDVLKIMQENLGLSAMSFEDFKEAAGEGEYGVQSFIDAFIEMTQKDFPNSMEAMGKTWAAVSSNIKDFFTQVLGVDVFKPMFDNVTAALSTLLDKVMKNTKLRDAFVRLGTVLGKLFNFKVPDNIDGILNGIADAVDSLATALDLLDTFGLESMLKYLNVPPDVIDWIFKLGDGLKWLADNWVFVAGVIAAVNVIPMVAEFLMGISALISGFMGLVATAGGFVEAIGILGTAFMASAAPWIIIIALIVAAIILLYVAWTQNWGGIQEKAAAVWAVVSPILASLYDWVSSKITAGLAFLTSAWNIAWNAMQLVWGWMQAVLFPFLNALSAVISAVLSIAITAMAGIWQNRVLPVLTLVAAFISAKLQPSFDKLSSFISSKVIPIVESMAAWISGSLVSAFVSLNQILSKATDWLNKMAVALSKLVLPPALTPGSPTPFEIGLWGIYDALRAVNNTGLKGMSMEFDVLTRQAQTVPAGYGGAAMASIGSYAATASSAGSGRTAVFNLKDTDLDEEQLRSLLRREDALYGNS